MRPKRKFKSQSFKQRTGGSISKLRLWFSVMKSLTRSWTDIIGERFQAGTRRRPKCNVTWAAGRLKVQQAMRVKIQFIAEEHVPSAIVELKFLPRSGEVLEVDAVRRMEVVEVVKTDADKRYCAVVKGKLLR